MDQKNWEQIKFFGGNFEGRYDYLFLELVSTYLLLLGILGFGIVAGWSFYLLWNFIRLPLTIDSSAYYFSSSVLVAMTILVIAGYACYISLGTHNRSPRSRQDDSVTCKALLIFSGKTLLLLCGLLIGLTRLIPHGI
jgi:hypothetical protein